MSRAINLNANQADVTKMCAKHGADISHMEELPAGGMRVVLRTGDSAVTIRRAFGSKVITGPVVRMQYGFSRR